VSILQYLSSLKESTILNLIILFDTDETRNIYC